MVLNSMASQSTALVSWIPHLRAAPLRLTPIGRSWRASHSKPIYAPSIRHCFQLNVIFLFRALVQTHRYYGLRVAKLTWTVRDSRRALQLRGYRWRLKFHTFLWSLPSSVQRTYWRHLHRPIRLIGRVRRSPQWYPPLRLMKWKFQKFRQRAAQQRSRGETHDIT